MSKSVLVIDTPEDCYSCYLRMVSRDLHFCKAKSRRIKDVCTKPDWCPLKPLPEKVGMSAGFAYWNDMADGWDQRIDVIIGGNTDD